MSGERNNPKLLLSPVSMSYIGEARSEPDGYWVLSKSHLHAAAPQVQYSQLDSWSPTLFRLDWTSHWCGRNMKWREAFDFLEMHLVARCVSIIVSLCTDGSLRVSPRPAHRRATSLVRSTKLQGQTLFSSVEAVKKGQSICPDENSAGTSIGAAK